MSTCLKVVGVSRKKIPASDVLFNERLAPASVLPRWESSSSTVQVFPSPILEDQSDCPLDSAGAYTLLAAALHQDSRPKEETDQMDQFDQQELSSLAAWDSQGTVTPAFDRLKSGHAGPHAEAGDGVSSTPRKDARAKFIGTWFRRRALFIIVVAVGLVIWPLRKLYLTLKEKFDERWDGTVL